MMLTCESCGSAFEPYAVIDGVRLNLGGRKHCRACAPLRRLARPRKRVPRRLRMNVCESCGAEFPSRMEIDGVVRNLQHRRFCLGCSPFGATTRPGRRRVRSARMSWSNTDAGV